MSGELWREIVQMGQESTPGTPVAATRKVYLMNVSATKERASRPKRFAVGRRDNVLDHRQGPVGAGGSIEFDMSGAEAVEWFLLGLEGGVTPTQPIGATTAQRWVFTPGGTTLDSATIERNDGANVQQLQGVRVNRMTIRGSTREANTVVCELFATDRDDTFPALTGGLTDRVPSYFEGWQTNFYVTGFGGTAGAGQVSDALISWEVVINNNLARRYFARDSLAASRVDTGVMDVTATVTLDASAATYLSEVADWLADTKRLVRLEFLGPADGIETGFREYVTVDLPGAWTSPDLNQADENARAGRFPLQYVYDPTNAYGIQVTAQNDRATAY